MSWIWLVFVVNIRLSVVCCRDVVYISVILFSYRIDSSVHNLNMLFVWILFICFWILYIYHECIIWINLYLLILLYIFFVIAILFLSLFRDSLVIVYIPTIVNLLTNSLAIYLFFSIMTIQ